MRLERELIELLSGLFDGRLYPIIAPEVGGGKAPPTPLMTYRVSRVRDYDLDGPDGGVTTTLYLEIYARTYPDAVALSAAVIDAAHAWEYADAIYIDDELHWSEQTVKPVLFRISQTWTVQHTNEA